MARSSQNRYQGGVREKARAARRVAKGLLREIDAVFKALDRGLKEIDRMRKQAGVEPLP